MKKKLKAYIYPNIANISIIWGSVGIIVHLISGYLQIHDRDVYYETFTYLNSLLVVVDFYDILPYLLDNNYYTTGGYNLFTLLFLTMLVLGGVIYKKTNRKDDRLLKFSYSTIFIFQLVGILTLVISYVDFNFINDQTNTLDISIFQWLWHLLYIIPFMVISYLLTKWLVREQELLLKNETKQNEDWATYVVEAGNGKRVLHWMFDTLLMNFVFGAFLLKAINFKTGSSYYDIDYWSLSLISLLILTLYYLITEGIFGASPIKFLTGTTVIDEDTNGKPGFKKIVGRTLSRHIPFEALSFVDGRGWHDSIPRTKVVNVKNGGSRSYHLIWGIIVLMIYIGPPLYSSIQKMLETKRENNFREQVRLKIQKSIIYNLDEGDAIITKPKRADRKSPYTLLQIISSGSDTIYTEGYIMPYSGKPYQESIANYKNSYLNFIDTFQFARKELLDIYKSGKGFRLQERDSLDYKIKTVLDSDHPTIRSRSSSSRITEDEVISTFQFTYNSMPVEVIDVRAIDGQVNWQTDLPIKPNFNEKSNKGSFNLLVKNYNTKRVYKAELKLRYNDNTHIYLIEGLDRNVEVYRKFE